MYHAQSDQHQFYKHSKVTMFPVTGYKLLVYPTSQCFIRMFVLSQVGALNKILYHLVRMFPGTVFEPRREKTNIVDWKFILDLQSRGTVLSM